MHIAFAQKAVFAFSSTCDLSPSPRDPQEPAPHRQPAYVTAGGLQVWPYAGLRKHSSLFREFAEGARTREGVRQFADRYGPLLSGLLGSHLDEDGKLILVFSTQGGEDPPDDALAKEAIVMRRCLLLHDMVRNED